MNTPKGFVDDSVTASLKGEEVVKKSELSKEPNNGLLSEVELDGVAGGNILPSVRLSVPGSSGSFS